MTTNKSPADTISERRLRPIYDWLDSGNNKKAIQEAERVLKKQSDLQCAKVLKGLAMIRLGKCKESEELLENVKKDVTPEEGTLQAMMMCYRELNKLEKVCDIYEKAVAKDPTNEEFNTHLFMSYVRIGDHKKQQQSALNLYKVKPKNPYYFWAVMSVVMQAQNASEDVAQKVILPLAQRMIKKFMDEGKIEADPEIQLYMMILEMQKNYSEALRILDGDLGLKSIPLQIYSLKRVALLKKLERWYTLNAYLKSTLIKELDAYNYYVLYIDSVFKLMNDTSFTEANGPLNCEDSRCKSDNCLANANENMDQADNNIKACVEFLNKCQHLNRKLKHRLRGPYLAQLLLCLKLVEIGEDPFKHLGCNAIDLIVGYFKVFGEKNCCLKDLCPFFSLVKDEHEAVLSTTWTELGMQHGDVPTSKRQLSMFLSYYQLQMHLGEFDSFPVEKKLDHVLTILKYYHYGTRYNVDLLPTDIRYNDMFIVLAAHMLYNVFLQTNDYIALRDALCLAEYGYSLSTSNYHLKLLLLKLYNTMGATKAAFKYYETLDIKHMQYESLGYLVVWTLLSTGQYGIAKQIIDNTVKFLNINYKETADQLTFGYKFGSFDKVIEITNFRMKLKNSYHLALVTVEQSYVEILHATSHELTVQAVDESSQSIGDLNIDLKILCDNRDTNIFVCYDPSDRCMREKHVALSFEHDVKCLQLKSLILRCMISCLNVEKNLARSKHDDQVNNHGNNVNLNKNNNTNSSGNINNDNTNNSVVVANSIIENAETAGDCSSSLVGLLKTVNELSEFYKDLKNNPPEEIPTNVYTGIEKSRLFLYLKSSYYVPLFVDAVKLVHLFYSHSLIGDIAEEQVDDKVELLVKQINELIQESKNVIENEIASTNYGTQLNTINNLVVTSEIVCILSIVCGVLYSLLMKSRTSKSIIPLRKKKKKEKVNNNSSSSSLVLTDEKSDASKRLSLAKTYRYFVTAVGDQIKGWYGCLSKLENGWHNMDNERTTAKLMEAIGNDESAEFIQPDRWNRLVSVVNDHILISYRSSIKEIRNIVSQKIDYVSNLQL